MGYRTVEVRRLRGGSQNSYDVVDLVNAVPGLLTNRGRVSRITEGGTVFNTAGQRVRREQSLWTTCTNAREAGLRR